MFSPMVLDKTEIFMFWLINPKLLLRTCTTLKTFRFFDNSMTRYIGKILFCSIGYLLLLVSWMYVSFSLNLNRSLSTSCLKWPICIWLLYFHDLVDLLNAMLLNTQAAKPDRITLSTSTWIRKCCHFLRFLFYCSSML